MTGSRPRQTDMATVFRALGDPSRLAIFELIRSCEPDEGETLADLENSVSEIAGQFDLSLSTVSHHLKELRRAGLIRCERRGQRIHCSIDPEVVAEVGRYLDGPQSGGRPAPADVRKADQAAAAAKGKGT